MATRSLKQLEKMNAPKPVSRAKSVSSGSMNVGAAKKPSYNKTATVNKTNAIKAKVQKANDISRISEMSGMKESAIKKAAEIGSRLGYDNPAYKDHISGIAEGYEGTAKTYTKILQNSRMKSKKKK